VTAFFVDSIAAKAPRIHAELRSLAAPSSRAFAGEPLDVALHDTEDRPRAWLRWEAEAP
jgi:hypothetical protein